MKTEGITGGGEILHSRRDGNDPFLKRRDKGDSRIGRDAGGVSRAKSAPPQFVQIDTGKKNVSSGLEQANRGGSDVRAE